MDRNRAQNPANAHYSYGQVESALAAVFGIDAAGQRGWLRGRLQHVRRLGLVAASPGRGRSIEYTRDDADKWLVAIELEHFNLGVDPTKVVELIKRRWAAPARKRSGTEAFQRGEASLSDLVAQARASRDSENDVIVTVRFGPMSAVPVVGYTTVKGIAGFGHWLGGDPLDPAPRRANVFNLSARLRALDFALADATKPQTTEPVISETAQSILDMGEVRRGAMTLKQYRAKHDGKKKGR